MFKHPCKKCLINSMCTNSCDNFKKYIKNYEIIFNTIILIIGIIIQLGFISISFNINFGLGVAISIGFFILGISSIIGSSIIPELTDYPKLETLLNFFFISLLLYYLILDSSFLEKIQSLLFRVRK